ncbi:hypothetical protein CYMTET_17006 [Cymbomonas tetramitiformis]|uniref:Uncharacterized protein n=1 Tax=Cymbomonas tetramitiformis TaxID=36881 RepID=A0AAE0GAY1_9CHLO|nr:hypothetical protein CYMTET_17006 [Cymbomonas tetramitiformis]
MYDSFLSDSFSVHNENVNPKPNEQEDACETRFRGLENRLERLKNHTRGLENRLERLEISHQRLEISHQRLENHTTSLEIQVKTKDQKLKFVYEIITHAREEGADERCSFFGVARGVALLILGSCTWRSAAHSWELHVAQRGSFLGVARGAALLRRK